MRNGSMDAILLWAVPVASMPSGTRTRNACCVARPKLAMGGPAVAGRFASVVNTILLLSPAAMPGRCGGGGLLFSNAEELLLPSQPPAWRSGAPMP